MRDDYGRLWDSVEHALVGALTSHNFTNVKSERTKGERDAVLVVLWAVVYWSYPAPFLRRPPVALKRSRSEIPD